MVVLVYSVIEIVFNSDLAAAAVFSLIVYGIHGKAEYSRHMFRDNLV